MSEIAVPDFTEPIVAIRAWNLMKDAAKDPLYLRRRSRRSTSVRLTSVSMTSVWPADEPFEATCTNRSHRSGESAVPRASCVCGIYAKSDAQGLAAEYSANLYIHGIVRLWGRVIPGETGWRAQYARIVALLARKWFDEETRDAARAYGVPVLRSLPDLTPPRSIPTVPEEEDPPTNVVDGSGYASGAIDVSSYDTHTHIHVVPQGAPCPACGVIST